MTVTDTNSVRALPRLALIGAGILLVTELFVIGTIFKHYIPFRCVDNWPTDMCQMASGSLVAIYSVLAALALLAMLVPHTFRQLVADAGQNYWPLAINAFGVILTLIPVAFLREGAGQEVILPSFAFWIAGMSALVVGLGLFVAPWQNWIVFLKQAYGKIGLAIVTGAAAPLLAIQIREVWRSETTIADITFTAVVWLLERAGYEVISNPELKHIGDETFLVRIAPQCSGIEGLALVTVFVTLFLVLFRDQLRFPRALWLYPVGLAASAIFNVVRISLLLVIGLEGNPDLAVGGFHSHAGWLMFTLVALGIIALAQNVPALQKSTTTPGAKAAPAPVLPFFSDPTVAKILPFAVFMLSALLAQVMSQNPGLVYPARVLFMAGVVALFWRVIAELPWRIDAVAVGSGVVVGLIWVAIPVSSSDSAAPYGTLTGVALLAWAVFRGLGTILFVPLIEELFFRGYLEKRLQFGNGAVWTITAVIVTSAIFAALHDRWLEAFFAALVFSWVARRQGNITDAIMSHLAANAVVYSVAVMTWNIGII